MYSRGKISELAAKSKEGFFIGRSLEKSNPWFSRNLEVGRQLLNSDMKEDLLSHAHQYVEEIIIALKGCLKMEVDGQAEELREGEIIFVKPKSPIRIIGADDGTEFLVLKSPSLSWDKYIANGTPRDKKQG